MREGIIFYNRILDVVFISMFTAQFLKVIMPIFKGKKPKLYKLFETGGMPSSHASTMSALTTCVAIVKHVNSIEFAIALVISSIVMYDATGIRREAGKHAKALNNIIFNNKNNVSYAKEFREFKEFLGHTPLEVLMGGLLGVFIAILFEGYLI